SLKGRRPGMAALQLFTCVLESVGAGFFGPIPSPPGQYFHRRVASLAQAAEYRSAMRTCIILNPIAGAVKNLDAIQDQLRNLKAERFCVSEGPGDAEKFDSEASDFDLIVSAGGNGTLNDLLNRIAQ